MRLDKERDDGAIAIMLTGTPGVGKSLFTIYLTHLIAHNEVNMISSIKKVCTIQKTPAGRRTLYFNQDEGGHWRAATLEEARTPPEVLISDCSDPKERPTVSALVKFNIVISSPRGVSFKTWVFFGLEQRIPHIVFLS